MKNYYYEINLRLEKMKEYYKILCELRKKCDLNSFKRDPVLRGALERYLQLSAEAALDIGENIIADKKLPIPMFHKDIFDTLGKEKILSKNLANDFMEIAKFRNILVHDYVNIDLEKMYDYLKNDLDDFKKYIIAIAKYLK